MNFLQLEYFLTILKFNSISKAASELYITQPALSQQLIHLEKELDTKLFYRKGNSLILTEAGERFRDSAQNMLYEYRTMQTMLAELKDNGSFSGTGHLSLAVTKTKSFITLTYLLGGFKQKYPNIEVSVTEVESGGVEELLENGSVDLGFCYSESNSAITHTNIYQEQILLAVPPQIHIPYQREPNGHSFPMLKFEDICSLPFIVGKTGYLRKYTQNLFEKHNCQPNIVLETSNPGLAHFLVAANVGCAFVGYISACVSPMYIENPLYCQLETPDFQQVCIGYNKQRHLTRPMKCFMDYAKQTMERPPFNISETIL